MNTKTTKRSLCVLIVAALCWEANVLQSQAVDDSNLLNITTLEQLDAVRYDLDGDGVPTVSGLSAYNAAFGMSIAIGDTDDASATVPNNPSTSTGYELMKNLDFNNPDSYAGSVDKGWSVGEHPDGADADSEPDPGGWTPIGDDSHPFIAIFDGNRRRISNLYIHTSTITDVGLFGVLGSMGVIHYLGLEGGTVKKSQAGQVGALVGMAKNKSTISACYATGNVTGISCHNVGGLVGKSEGLVGGGNNTTISACYATGNVTGRACSALGGLVGRTNYTTISACYATGNITINTGTVGGLVGEASGRSLIACYATGNITIAPPASSNINIVGGLVGDNYSSIAYCYAIGRISGAVGTRTRVGSLVGQASSDLGDSYFNSELSGITLDVGEPPAHQNTSSSTKTTAQLQRPTSYTDLDVASSGTAIYSNWNVDIDNADGDGTATTGVDNPWDFGTVSQYPVLRVDFNGDGTPSALEFGVQRNIAAPVFALGGTYSFTVAENAAFRETVSATDPEGSALSYSLSTTTTEARGWFQINADGLITNAEMIDYEALGMSKVITLSITAHDGAWSTTQVLTITVTDVPAPVFESSGTYTFTVAENAAFSQTVVASNPSGATLSYSLSTTTTEARGWFQINADGLITNAEMIDYEALGMSKVLRLTITATAGGESTTQEVTITVTNVDEAPVFALSGTYAFTVAENETFGQSVVATDPEGSALSYSLSTTTTEARGWFQINADGLITNAEMIDYEALGMSKVLRLTITATAGGESTTQEVTITVTNVDEAPVFALSGTYAFTVAENETFGQSVVATDPEGSALSYSLSTTTTEARGWFQINADGLITNAQTIDYEALGMSKVLRLTITATAGGESTEQEVTITVTDVDENAAPAPFGVANRGDEGPRFYPNPAVSSLYVSGLETGRTYSYTLSTLLGKRALVGYLLASRVIDLSQLPVGSYVFVLYDDRPSELLRETVLVK